MNCKQVQQKMLAYAEKLLEPSASAQVAAHVQHCAACAQELRAIEQTFQLLQAAPLQEPPEAFWTDFTSRVMRRINTMDVPAPPKAWFFFPRWKMAFVLAVVLGVIGGGYLYFQTTWRQSSPSVATTGFPGATSPTASLPAASDETFRTALRKIAPPDLTPEVLKSDFALFDGTTELASAGEESEETLAWLITSLTAEEKKALLAELYKLEAAAQ